MQKHAKKFYTIKEYLALEETSEYKNEYYHGEIFAMSGASLNHNRIVSNVNAKLNTALFDKKCEVFSNDLRIWVKSKNLFTYPDLVVLCDPPEFYPDRDDTIANPLLIIEVLSESTKSYDRGDKFMFYRAIPSFEEYILIDQYSVHIEHFTIGSEGKWVLTEYDNLQDILILTKINLHIPLSEIYNKVEFMENTNRSLH